MIESLKEAALYLSSASQKNTTLLEPQSCDVFADYYSVTNTSVWGKMFKRCLQVQMCLEDIVPFQFRCGYVFGILSLQSPWWMISYKGRNVEEIQFIYIFYYPIFLHLSVEYLQSIKNIENTDNSFMVFETINNQLHGPSLWVENWCTIWDLGRILYIVLGLQPPWWQSGIMLHWFSFTF